MSIKSINVHFKHISRQKAEYVFNCILREAGNSILHEFIKAPEEFIEEISIHSQQVREVQWKLKPRQHQKTKKQKTSISRVSFVFHRYFPPYHPELPKIQTTTQNQSSTKHQNSQDQKHSTASQQEKRNTVPVVQRKPR